MFKSDIEASMGKSIKVNILLSENALYSTVFNIYDMLSQAGVFWNYLIGEKPEPKFKVTISSIDKEAVTNTTKATILPHRKISNRDRFDIIIVPSEGMSIDLDTESFIQRSKYLKRMHDRGAMIASVCTGAFLLAKAGLLDGKIATTHWAIEKNFKKNFPHVKLDTNLILADAGQVITSGGVSADSDLAMELIKRYYGKEMAYQSAKCTLVSLEQRTQKQYKTYIFEQDHDDKEVLRCQNYIKKNINSELSVKHIAEKFSFSERNLNRRFNTAAGMSVLRYIQYIKIEEAKLMIMREECSFDEISFRLGYENTSFFRKLFKNIVGLTPKEYEKNFVS